MIEEHESVRHFDMSRIYFGKPQFSETSIRVPVRKLIVNDPYEGRELPDFYKSCILIYEGVIGSERKVSEYATPGVRVGFKRHYKIDDGPFANHGAEVFLHFLYGVSEDLHAWVHWQITASAVRIEDEVHIE